MRLLIINPNTTQAITDLLADTARRFASPGATIKTATGAFGAQVIASRMEMAIGDYAALDAAARESADCDAVIIGASIDSGLRAVRQMFPGPVIGLTEAALHVANLTASRFGLLISNLRSANVMREIVEGYGLGDRLAGIRGLATSAESVLADPAATEAAMIEAAGRLVTEDQAEVVILVGAVMAGMPERIQDRVPVPVLEGMSCAVPLVEALVRIGIAQPRAGGFAPPVGRAVSGLSDALTARFKA